MWGIHVFKLSFNIINKSVCAPLARHDDPKQLFPMVASSGEFLENFSAISEKFHDFSHFVNDFPVISQRFLKVLRFF